MESFSATSNFVLLIVSKMAAKMAAKTRFTSYLGSHTRCNQVIGIETYFFGYEVSFPANFDYVLLILSKMAAKMAAKTRFTSYLGSHTRCN